MSGPNKNYLAITTPITRSDSTTNLINPSYERDNTICGIVYAKSFDNQDVSHEVLTRFKAQRSRGIDGFGFYTPETNRLTHNPRENRIVKLLKRTQASEILFHHRFPTSTDNVRNACHPFSTKNTFKHNYVLVHNGIISNSRALQLDHKERGIEYISKQADGRFNDSEALLYDIALYLEGEQDKLKAEGDIAFICVENDETGQAVKLHYGRNHGSPLMLEFNDSVLTIASEGKGTAVEAHKLCTFDYATQKLTTVDLEIPDYQWQTWQNPVRTSFYLPEQSGGPYGKNGNSLYPLEPTPRRYQRYEDDWYFDTKANRMVNYLEPELIYDPEEARLSNLAGKAWSMAEDLIDRHVYYDDALSDCQDIIDSLAGKITRMGKRIQSDKHGKSKHYQSWISDQHRFHYDLEIAETALELIMESFDTSRTLGHTVKEEL